MVFCFVLGAVRWKGSLTIFLSSHFSPQTHFTSTTPSLSYRYHTKTCSKHSFLNAVDRIAAPKYVPADPDIVRARLRTVGVQEHQLTLDSGPEPGRDWLIFDVGGARSAVSIDIRFCSLTSMI